MQGARTKAASPKELAEGPAQEDVLADAAKMSAKET